MKRSMVPILLTGLVVATVALVATQWTGEISDLIVKISAYQKWPDADELRSVQYPGTEAQVDVSCTSQAMITDPARIVALAAGNLADQFFAGDCVEIFGADWEQLAQIAGHGWKITAMNIYGTAGFKNFGGRLPYLVLVDPRPKLIQALYREGYLVAGIGIIGNGDNPLAPILKACEEEGYPQCGKQPNDYAKWYFAVPRSGTIILTMAHHARIPEPEIQSRAPGIPSP